MLTKLDMSKSMVGEVMAYIITHSEYAEEIVSLICRSLSITATPVFPLKISRLYLISDILYNSSSNVPNCWKYRTYFERELPNIFKHLGYVRRNLQKRLKQEQMRIAVSDVITSWEKWIVFPSSYMKNLMSLFLDLDTQHKRRISSPQQSSPSTSQGSPSNESKNVTGIHFRPVPEVSDNESTQAPQNQHDSPPVKTSLCARYADLSDSDLSGLTTPEELP